MGLVKDQQYHIQGSAVHKSQRGMLVATIRVAFLWAFTMNKCVSYAIRLKACRLLHYYARLLQLYKAPICSNVLVPTVFGNEALRRYNKQEAIVLLPSGIGASIGFCTPFLLIDRHSA